MLTQNEELQTDVHVLKLPFHDLVEAIKKLDILSSLPSFVDRNIENIPSKQPE